VKRTAYFVYGTVCYLAFFGIFLYTIGFLGNWVVPKSIDSGAAGSLGPAVLIDVSLLLLFGLQHSVMARRAFKRWWTRIVPRPIERSTYVLATCIVLALLFWQWRPLPAILWEAGTPVGRALLSGLYLGGLALVFYSTVLIDHFDLFGLRQVMLHWRQEGYVGSAFVTPSLYKVIRHPLYVGWFITFWVTPVMTVGHLLFAAVATAYILAAVQLEERDLLATFGADYEQYRKRTPMFVPIPRRRPAAKHAPSTR
jgi:protein-S-isoprenylcysteine O-methyltransferase Ste14